MSVINIQDHLKPRYKFPKVCKIFGIHEDTLRSWMRDGIPVAGGRRIRLRYLQLGRKVEFECEEIERVYQELRGGGVDDDFDAAA